MTMPHPAQTDLFDEALFPSRIAAQSIDLPRFKSKLKRGMAQAIRQCPYNRPTITARMAQYLGVETVSKSSLDAYTAESKETHEISLSRFKAFVHATGAVWLWDLVIAEDGLLLLQGDEARLAEIARLQQEQRELHLKLKTLRSSPVIIKRRQHL